MAEHVMLPNPGENHMSETRPETRGSGHTGNTWLNNEHVMRPNPGEIHLSEIRPETRGSDHTVYSNHVPDEGR